jgi:type II secretory pathway pseudopilin PulG
VLGNIKEKGFTITELVIASVLGSMLAITLFTITIFMYGGVMRNDVQARLTLESQNILRRVVEDLRVSAGIHVSNTIPDINEPLGGWTTSNTDLILIVATPVLDSSNNFIIDSTSGEVYLNEIIYYADDNTLFKRILANPDALGNTFTTSCPPALATVACPADRTLSTSFDNMIFTFYDQDDNTTADPTLARSVEITINMTNNVFGQDVTIDNNIRVTLRNSI